MYKYTNGEILDEEYFMDQFSKVTDKITPENYKEEVEDGLYKDTEIAVTKETQQLKFRYKAPDGQLIEQENVPVVIDGTSVKSIRYFTALSTTTEKPAEDKFTETVKDVDSVNRFLWQYVVTELTDGTSQGSYADAKCIGVYGDEGEQGERGAEYLGCFASNSDAYNSREGNLVIDDFYLNSTDGYIHVVVSSELIEEKIKAEWASITDYTDPRYKQAMNDMIAIAGSDRSEGFMSVVNLWVKNLTAQTALIQNLFAKVMKMENGGIFKSDNYDGTITETKDSHGNVTDRNITSYGTQGFAMDSHGKMDIVGMNATNITIDNMNIGRKNGNTVLGKWALDINNEGVTQNIAIGDNAMLRCSHSDDDNNIAIGTASLRNNKGFHNIAIGSGAIADASNLDLVTEGDYNIGIGYNTLRNCTSTPGNRSSNNIAIGKEAGLRITTGSHNICIGEYSKVHGDREANYQININDTILYKQYEMSETYAELYSYFSQAIRDNVYFGCTGIFDEKCVAYGKYNSTSKTVTLYSPTGNSIATIKKDDATVIAFNYYIMIIKG